MNNFWQKLDKPIIGLAPMAGISDSPFRMICKDYGAELVYSEMISSYGLVHNNKKANLLSHFRKRERPIIIQIFGREPSIMAQAAKIIEENIKADGIDINFGCPARRVIKSGHGAALMDEVKLAEKIAFLVVKAVKIPVSVKCRLGAKEKNEIYNFAKRMENSGICAIAIHGRTLTQGYKGQADWQPIYQVKKKTSMLVLGNGDIKDKKDIAERLSRGNLDGVLIGRGALGNPFIFEGMQVIKKDAVRFLKNNGFVCGEVGLAERKKIILKHADLMCKEKKEKGMIEYRKHLGWYVKGWPKAKLLRQKLVKVKTIEEIKNILSEL